MYVCVGLEIGVVVFTVVVGNFTVQSMEVVYKKEFSCIVSLVGGIE